MFPGLRTRHCPDCGAEMKETRMHGVDLDLCPECNGIWLDHGELKEILQRRISERANPRDMAAANACDRTCPECKRHLFVRHFAGCEIDQCINCAGIFLDGGELEQIQEAVHSGRFQQKRL
jgi:Zn-finger nucleic acid-binding protein